MNDRQFSLASIFIATAFIAVGCALGRYAVTAQEPFSRALALFAIPLLALVAVAVLRQRVTVGIVIGIGIVIAMATIKVWWLYLDSHAYF